LILLRPNDKIYPKSKQKDIINMAVVVIKNYIFMYSITTIKLYTEEMSYMVIQFVSLKDKFRENSLKKKNT